MMEDSSDNDSLFLWAYNVIEHWKITPAGMMEDSSDNDSLAFRGLQCHQALKRRQALYYPRKAVFYLECQETTWEWDESTQGMQGLELYITSSTACGESKWNNCNKQEIQRQKVFIKVAFPF